MVSYFLCWICRIITFKVESSLHNSSQCLFFFLFCGCCSMSLGDQLLHIKVTTLLLLFYPITILLFFVISSAPKHEFFSLLIVHKVYISDGKTPGKTSTFIVLKENVGRQNLGEGIANSLFHAWCLQLWGKHFPSKPTFPINPWDIRHFYSVV